MNKKLINIDPEIMGGTPVFNRTRVPVRSIFDWLETETLGDFLENFPTVTRKQAIGVLNTAEEMVLNKTTPDEVTAG
jgi:uncharacterized protein (DUF433 family)